MAMVFIVQFLSHFALGEVCTFRWSLSCCRQVLWCFTGVAGWPAVVLDGRSFQQPCNLQHLACCSTKELQFIVAQR